MLNKIIFVFQDSESLDSFKNETLNECVNSIDSNYNYTFLTATFDIEDIYDLEHFVNIVKENLIK